MAHTVMLSTSKVESTVVFELKQQLQLQQQHLAAAAAAGQGCGCWLLTS